jgi:hypothetical protein
VVVGDYVEDVVEAGNVVEVVELGDVVDVGDVVEVVELGDVVDEELVLVDVEEDVGEVVDGLVTPPWWWPPGPTVPLGRWVDDRGISNGFEGCPGLAAPKARMATKATAPETTAIVLPTCTR